MKKMLLIILAMNLASCSMSGPGNETASVKNDDLEFAVDSLDENIASEEFHVEEQQIASVEPKFDDFKEELSTNNDIEIANVGDADIDESYAQVTAEAPVRAIVEHKAIVPIEKSQVEIYQSSSFLDEMEHYTVQKGDTLMMVAFKIYGDYGKWKEIQKWNHGVKKLSAGMQLQYQVPEKAFGWMPSGEAYLIKTGDTLGTISMDKYHTSRKWRSLYENNKPLIKDPNLIFAGFTIYYHPERQLASEVK